MFTSLLLANAALASGDIGRYTSAVTSFYLMGGADSSLYAKNTTAKINASTMANANIAATMSLNKFCGASVTNALKSYYVGGYNNSTGSYYNSAHSLRFADDTIALLSSVLPNSVSNCAGLNTENTGFIINDNLTALYKLSFASETFSTDSKTTPARYGFNGMGVMSASAGYNAGMQAASPTSEIYKLNFVDHTSGFISATINVAKIGTFAMQNAMLKAYFYAGSSSANNAITDISVLDLVTEAKLTVSATANTAYTTGSSGGTASNGYAFGGYSNALGTATKIQGIAFSNETSFASGVSLAVARRCAGSAQI